MVGLYASIYGNPHATQKQYITHYAPRPRLNEYAVSRCLKLYMLWSIKWPQCTLWYTECFVDKRVCVCVCVCFLLWSGLKATWTDSSVQPKCSSCIRVSRVFSAENVSKCTVHLLFTWDGAVERYVSVVCFQLLICYTFWCKMQNLVKAVSWCTRNEVQCWIHHAHLSDSRICRPVIISFILISANWSWAELLQRSRCWLMLESLTNLVCSVLDWCINERFIRASVQQNPRVKA